MCVWADIIASHYRYVGAAISGSDKASHVRGYLLAGLVVALALIPEAIAFSIIAGVDPKVGLHASFSMAVVIAIAGGRPGMISEATLLIGLLQILAGILKLGR